MERPIQVLHGLLVMVDQAVEEVTTHQLPELHRAPIRLREVRDMDTHLDWAAVVVVQPQLVLQVLRVLVPEMVVKDILSQQLIPI
jgi:hypothetical protein